MGVTIYAFYALQPYLLELYGNRGAYGLAGLIAATIAGTQIVGGLIAPLVGRLFGRRTDVLIVAAGVSIGSLALIGWTSHLSLAITAVVLWGIAFFASIPMRQAYLNGIVPSAHRATVLSFDNLMGSAGGVVAQPALGRVADASGYAWSYSVTAMIHVLALPFLFLARSENAASDVIEAGQAEKMQS
jgi:MFS family permease